MLCAKELQIEALAIPVNSNTSVELSKAFKQVTRTRIGSPYVIAEFDALAKQYNAVAGYEANGGFLLGTDIELNNRVLKALPTRDALLPAIMLLAAAKGSLVISDLVKTYSLRFSASDRIQNFATQKSQAIIKTHSEDPSQLIKLLGFDDVTVESVNTVDGLRITLSNTNVIHLRPSGNAPELRCYAESTSDEKAKALVVQVLNKVKEL